MEQENELNRLKEETRKQRQSDQSDQTWPKREEDNKKEETDDQFEHIAAEIRRQHELLSKAYDSLDTKIGIILGFVFLVLTQIAFRPEFADLAAKNAVLFAVFLVGLGTIIGSIVMGIKGLFFVGVYDIGPRIADLVDEFKAGKDLNQVISRGISNALAYDIKRSESKARWLERMLIALIIGFVMLIVLEMLLYVL